MRTHKYQRRRPKGSRTAGICALLVYCSRRGGYFVRCPSSRAIKTDRVSENGNVCFFGWKGEGRHSVSETWAFFNRQTMGGALNISKAFGFECKVMCLGWLVVCNRELWNAVEPEIILSQ